MIVLIMAWLINGFGWTGSTVDLSPVVDRIAVLENNEIKVTYFASVSAASGTITPPANATILTGQLPAGADAFVSTIVNGEPTGDLPQTAGGTPITVTSFNSSGNYVLSGTPGSFPVALIYVIKIKTIYESNLVIGNIITPPEDINVAQIGDPFKASEIVLTSSGKKLITVAAADAFNKPFGTGANTVTQGNDSRMTNARNRQIFAQQNIDSTHTGDTNETILCNLAVPANTLGSNDQFEFFSHVFSTTQLNNRNFKAYLSPNNNSLSGATQIAAFNLSGTNISACFTRRLTNKNSQTSQTVMSVSTSLVSDFGQTSAARSSLSIDFTTNLWFIITLALVNSGDTAGLDDVELYINKA